MDLKTKKEIFLHDSYYWLKIQNFEKLLPIKHDECFDKNLHTALTFDGKKFYTHIKSMDFYAYLRSFHKDAYSSPIVFESRGCNHMIYIIDEDNKYMNLGSLFFPLKSIIGSYNDLMQNGFILKIFEEIIYPIKTSVANVYLTSLIKVAFQHPGFGVLLRLEYNSCIKIMDKHRKKRVLGKKRHF